MSGIAISTLRKLEVFLIENALTAGQSNISGKFDSLKIVTSDLISKFLDFCADQFS